MKKETILIWALSLCSGVLLSLPWLVPHAGSLALVALVPLLCAEYIAGGIGMKRFWLCHYCCFVLWNALTTWWVGNATVGGGIFAVLANALQMSVVFALFRLARRHFKGAVPYIFLAVTWLAWEHAYFGAQISWPWLVLGHAFADTTRLVQWYSATGVLGGSLWILAANLAVFGLMVSLSDGSWMRWNGKARAAASMGLVLIFFAPALTSLVMYHNYEQRSEGKLAVIAAQPNFDPYEKFSSMSQTMQNKVLLNLYDDALEGRDTSERLLLLAPETFTGDILLNSPEDSPTLSSFRDFLDSHPACDLLFGASTYEIFNTCSKPSILARSYGDGWTMNHNSAVMAREDGGLGIYHKSRLVVGTELTPYPKIFVPLDEWLSGLLGVRGLIARCSGQPEPSILHTSDGTGVACAVCYESVYGDYCTEFVKLGARFLAVITNDAWWGDTPGYRQHMDYSRLRAIELRRDVARCANTGISCFINQRGDVISETPWWERCTIGGEVDLNSSITPFVRYGDMTGRAATFFFVLLAAALVVRLVKK